MSDSKHFLWHDLGKTLLTRSDVRANVDKWLLTSQLRWGFLPMKEQVLHMCTNMIYNCLCGSFSSPIPAKGPTWAALWRTTCRLVSTLHCCCVLCADQIGQHLLVWITLLFAECLYAWAIQMDIDRKSALFIPKGKLHICMLPSSSSRGGEGQLSTREVDSIKYYIINVLLIKVRSVLNIFIINRPFLHWKQTSNIYF